MIARLVTTIVILALIGCSVPSILYRIDVQQGNVITEEMLEKLKPGMTKSQVVFVLGSPLIIDPFRDNRWDYVFLFREKGNLVEQTRMSLFFDGDQLTTIQNHTSLAKASEKSKPVIAKPAEKELAPVEKTAIATINTTTPTENAIAPTTKAITPVEQMIAPVAAGAGASAVAATATTTANKNASLLEGKNAAVEKKVDRNEKRRMIDDDDDDDYCNVPSTVSIKP